MVEGMLCGLADGLDALRAQGAEVRRLILIGGGARSQRRPADRADGARLAGDRAADRRVRRRRRRPAGGVGAAGTRPSRRSGRKPVPSCSTPSRPRSVRERYAEVRDLTAPQL